MTARPMITNICELGLYSPDPDRLANFYQAVLGLEIVGRGRINADGVPVSIFLGSHQAEAAHQIAIFAQPENKHIAFQVGSLADLRAFHQHVLACGLPIKWAFNHGISLAFYFADPAGNLIKITWFTGVSCPQPHSHPIDLSQPEAVLHQDVANLVAQLKRLKGSNNDLKSRV